MSDRLTNYEVNGLAGAAAHTVPGGRRLILLAREVQASRKLIADLRENHEALASGDCWRCKVPHPCPTIRMMDEAGL